VRTKTGLHFWSDFANVRGLVEFGDQALPAYLVQRDSESLESWRDRLYHQFRIPALLAALSDLKVPYVEITNPLLSRQLVTFVRTMPDHLRTSKGVFKASVLSLKPRVDMRNTLR
jgi:hypothetical protein